MFWRQGPRTGRCLTATAGGVGVPPAPATHRWVNAPDNPPPGVTLVSDLPGAVAAAEDAAGTSTYVNVLGANVGRQCLQAGLLDEMVVFFAPVVLGRRGADVRPHER